MKNKLAKSRGWERGEGRMGISKEITAFQIKHFIFEGVKHLF
jgi:hypothetical protein